MSWEQLLSIMHTAREERAENDARPLRACPLCGWAPLDTGPEGQLHCPAGDWVSTTWSPVEEGDTGQ